MRERSVFRARRNVAEQCGRMPHFAPKVATKLSLKTDILFKKALVADVVANGGDDVLGKVRAVKKDCGFSSLTVSASRLMTIGCKLAVDFLREEHVLERFVFADDGGWSAVLEGAHFAVGVVFPFKEFQQCGCDGLLNGKMFFLRAHVAHCDQLLDQVMCAIGKSYGFR